MNSQSPCAKCGYPKAEHTDLRLVYRKTDVAGIEAWEEHPKLLKCLFGRKRGYEPKFIRGGEIS